MIRQIRKGLNFTIIFLFVSLPLPYPVKAESIRMAWFTIPPHVFVAKDGVTPKGPTIELFNTIAGRMGCTVEWVGPLPLSRLTKYQTHGGGRIDGSVLCEKAPVLLPFLYYPKEAYFIGHPCLAVRADNTLTSIKTIDDIGGYRIGFVSMFAGDYPPFFQNNLDKVTFQNISGNNWTSRNLAKLLLNRIDAVYELNRYSLKYQAVVDGVADKIRILNIPVEPIAHYYVFHKNSPKGEQLLHLYEKAVTGMNINYDRMVKREIEKYRRK